MKTYTVMDSTTNPPTLLEFSTFESAREWTYNSLVNMPWAIFDEDGKPLEYREILSYDINKMKEMMEHILDIKAADQAISKLEKGEDEVIDAKEMWHELQGLK